MFLNSNKGYPRQLIKTDGRCPTNMFVGQGVPVSGAPIGRVIPGTDFTTLPKMVSNIRTKMNSLNWSSIGLTKPSVIYATMAYTDEGEDSFPSMVYLYRACDSLTNDRIPLPQLMASGGLSAANSVWEAANSYTDVMDFGDVRFVSSVGNTTQGSNAIHNPEAMSLSRSDGKYIWLFPGFNVMRTWCLNCTNCPYTDTYASMQCGNMVQTAVQVGNRVLIKDYIGSEAYKNGIYEITQKNVVYYDDNPACTSPESRGSLRVSCGPTYIATVTLKLARISNFNALSPVRSEPVYSRLGLATLILIYGVGSYAAAFAYGTLGAREDFTTYIRDGQDHIKEVYRGIYADMARGIGKSPPDSS